MPAAAGVNHQSQPLRRRIRRGECRERPGRAKRAPVRGNERELVSRCRRKPRHVELPEIAGGRIRLAAHACGTDLELGCSLLCLGERHLDQKAVVTCGRDQVLNITLIPVLLARGRPLGRRCRPADTRRDQTWKRCRGCAKHEFASRRHLRSPCFHALALRAFFSILRPTGRSNKVEALLQRAHAPGGMTDPGQLR